MNIAAKAFHVTALSLLALSFILGHALLSYGSSNRARMGFISGMHVPGVLQNPMEMRSHTTQFVDHCGMRLHWPQTRCLSGNATTSNEDIIECDAVIFVSAVDDERLQRLHDQRVRWVRGRQSLGDQMCYVTLRTPGPHRHKLGRGFAKYEAGLLMSGLVTSGKIRSRSWRSTEPPWVLQMEYDSTPLNKGIGFIDLLRRLEMGLVQRSLEEIHCQADDVKCYELKRGSISAPAFFAALSLEPTCQQPKGGVTGSVMMYQPGPHIALIFHSVIEAASSAKGRHARDLPWFNKVVADLAHLDKLPRICDMPRLPKTRLFSKRNLSLSDLLGSKTTPEYAKTFLAAHQDDIKWLSSQAKADRVLAVVHPRWFNSLACPDDLSKRPQFAYHDGDLLGHYLSCTKPLHPPTQPPPLLPNP